MDTPAFLNLDQVPLLPKQIATRDSRHWNSAIKHQASLRNDSAILSTFTRMEALGISPNIATLPLVFKACGNLRALEKGKKIHRDIEGESHLINDVRVGTSVVDFYCKCGSLRDAWNVFDKMPQRDVVSWNAMISGCVECSEYEKALMLFMEMQDENLWPNARTVVSLFRACGELSEFRLGQELHGYCLRNGILEKNSHVNSALISFYSRFDQGIDFRDSGLLDSSSTVSWNTMISIYFDAGDYVKVVDSVLEILDKGINYDNVTLLLLIQACAELGAFELGMQVHQLVIKHGFREDLPIVDALMKFYAAMGRLEFSFDLFVLAARKDVILWNSMILAYLQKGCLDEGIILFKRMRSEGIRPNEISVIGVLNSLVGLETGLRNGRSLHTHLIKCGMDSDKVARNALLNMYGNLDSVDDAFMIFMETECTDQISWNILISMLAHNQRQSQALSFFTKMQTSEVAPNSHTIISALAACDDIACKKTGKSLHGYVIKKGIKVDAPLNAALVEMYMNCGEEATASSLFENFKDKDLISWNAMIANYVKNSQAHKALLLFHRMILEVQPNSSTIVSSISACTELVNLPQGLSLHAYVLKRVALFGFTLPVANAFITMYAKCGSMKYAESIFYTLTKKNSVSWNALIAGYGMHGRASDALRAFSKMSEEGFMATDITFVSVLSACSHSGWVEKGMELYNSMIQDFNITPKLAHYACVVDLLSRGGRLDEAMAFIQSMPIAPDASVLRALLGGCRVYFETRYAKAIFDKLVELEPMNAGNYVLLSNVYAAAGQWSDVEKLRALMEKNKLIKPPGKSWISVGNKIHEFTAGDRFHPMIAQIRRRLSDLVFAAKARGYVPDIRWVLHDEEKEDKVRRLLSHSEKLAISFGLIQSVGSAPIRITKNLRTCGDCHEFFKHVSELVGREIILRDGIRFHHFKEGVCSCKDYW